MKTIARTMPRTDTRHPVHTLWDCCWAAPVSLLDFDDAQGQIVQYAACQRCANLYARQNGGDRVHPMTREERTQITFTPVVDCAECLPDEDDTTCLDGPEGCTGTVEYRAALSATGTSFPRCDGHWSKRLDVQDAINTRYGHPDSHVPPADFDPSYAGESWDED